MCSFTPSSFRPSSYCVHVPGCFPTAPAPPWALGAECWVCYLLPRNTGNDNSNRKLHHTGSVPAAREPAGHLGSSADDLGWAPSRVWGLTSGGLVQDGLPWGSCGLLHVVVHAQCSQGFPPGEARVPVENASAYAQSRHATVLPPAA